MKSLFKYFTRWMGETQIYAPAYPAYSRDRKDGITTEKFRIQVYFQVLEVSFLLYALRFFDAGSLFLIPHLIVGEHRLK